MNWIVEGSSTFVKDPHSSKIPAERPTIPSGIITVLSFVQPEALKSWIQEKMFRSQHPESESNDIFQASEFVELDIPHASKHQITPKMSF